MNEQLILASASPRRTELLDQIGIKHVVHSFDIDETPLQAEEAIVYVRRVAAAKSAKCIQSVDFGLPVLAADTAVVLDGKILGKPRNENHALDMLNQLSGQSHIVYSAVSFRKRGVLDECTHFQTISKTVVKFRNLKTKEIHAYWKTGEPQGKAGSYAIQGLGGIFVESIKGSFSGVVGLPLFETAELLSKQGIRVIT